MPRDLGELPKRKKVANLYWNEKWIDKMPWAFSRSRYPCGNRLALPAKSKIQFWITQNWHKNRKWQKAKLQMIVKHNYDVAVYESLSCARATLRSQFHCRTWVQWSIGFLMWFLFEFNSQSKRSMLIHHSSITIDYISNRFTKMCDGIDLKSHSSRFNDSIKTKFGKGHYHFYLTVFVNRHKDELNTMNAIDNGFKCLLVCVRRSLPAPGSASMRGLLEFHFDATN